MLTPFSDLAVVAFVDPAGGKRQTQAIRGTRARSAIVVLAQDPQERIFVLDAWADRCSTEALIERIFETDATWHPQTFGIEADGQQSLFADSVSLAARWQGRSLPVAAVKHSTVVDKDWRIRTALQPVIADGRLFIPDTPAFADLRAEVRTFPMGRLKDLVDALASAIQLAPRRALPRERDAEVDDLARYLRESGVAPHLIRQRVASLLGTAA